MKRVKRVPLSREMVIVGKPKHAPCLGEIMIMSIMVNGVREDGICKPCHDVKNCNRVRRGEKPLPPLNEGLEGGNVAEI